jgi:hypothetical protein
LAASVQKLYPVPVKVDNDANAAALAETRRGAARAGGGEPSGRWRTGDLGTLWCRLGDRGWRRALWVTERQRNPVLVVYLANSRHDQTKHQTAKDARIAKEIY